MAATQTDSKLCRKCFSEKSTQEFGTDRSTKDGLAHYCKVCRRLAKKQYYRKNREAVIRKESDRQRSRRRTQGAIVRAGARCRYRNKKDIVLVQNSASWERNKDGINSRRRQRFASDTEARKKKNAYNRKWSKNNRDKVAEQSQRRRARKHNAETEPIDRFVVFVRDCGRCHLCGKFVSRYNFHLDHVRPISRDGNHLYENLKVACPKCNLRKSNKLMEEL